MPKENIFIYLFTFHFLISFPVVPTWNIGHRLGILALSLVSRVRIPLGAWMSVVFICRVVLCRYRSLRRAVHSSRGVLPCVCMCVITETPKREAKGPSWTISACE
jgi:hypothetical protein